MMLHHEIYVFTYSAKIPHVNCTESIWLFLVNGWNDFYPLSIPGVNGCRLSAANGKTVWQRFSPKQWEETDVDVKVGHCGICGSREHSFHSSREWVLLYPPSLVDFWLQSNLKSSSQPNIPVTLDMKSPEQLYELDRKLNRPPSWRLSRRERSNWGFSWSSGLRGDTVAIW
jgi:hypothetical protein